MLNQVNYLILPHWTDISKNKLNLKEGELHVT